jgi:tRNA pseudouridine55 synthase
VLEGIINLNKPVGISSASAVHRIRAITGQRKSGHAGTLDPTASGVLLVCLGRATKLVEAVMDLPKVYRATARLDVTSASFDSEVEGTPVPVGSPPATEDVAAACRSFVGDIEQVPPALSAVKVGGVPAYRRVARGQNVELSPRRVRIESIAVHAYQWPWLDFEVTCGRGTYIRSLIRDLGGRLATGGCLTSLARLRVGPFRLEDAWTIEAIREAGAVPRCIIPLEEARARIANHT